MSNIVMLTPFNGQISDLVSNIEEQLNKITPPYQWIIVLDHCEWNIGELPKYDNITFLESSNQPGAGNARNYGLDYIRKNLMTPYALLPIDSDDLLTKEAATIIRQSYYSHSEKLITFGHIKDNGKTKKTFSYEGVYSFKSLLKKYITPCGSTILKIEKDGDLAELQFGVRRRANDQNFFLSAARKFNGVRCYPDPVLIYKTGNPSSLSGQKRKMIYYKFMALRDLGCSNISSVYYMFYYAYHSLARYLK